MTPTFTLTLPPWRQVEIPIEYDTPELQLTLVYRRPDIWLVVEPHLPALVINALEGAVACIYCDAHANWHRRHAFELDWSRLFTVGDYEIRRYS